MSSFENRSSGSIHSVSVRSVFSLTRQHLLPKLPQSPLFHKINGWWQPDFIWGLQKQTQKSGGINKFKGWWRDGRRLHKTIWHARMRWAKLYIFLKKNRLKVLIIQSQRIKHFMLAYGRKTNFYNVWSDFCLFSFQHSQPITRSGNSI